MKKVAIDTNVLVGFLLGRQPQYSKAQVLFTQCSKGKITIIIPLPVVLETEWVLRSNYKTQKGQVILFFQELLILDNLFLSEKNLLSLALSLYKRFAVSFTDCVIMAEVLNFKPDQFVSFDKKLLNVYRKLKKFEQWQKEDTSEKK